MGAIEVVEKTQMTERPQMQAGDTVKVHVKVREGDKERIQVFEGIVIGMHRGGVRASFTVRKVSFGQGVERIFPLHSPIIQKVEVVRSAKVRRAKLYFLRDLKGKAARMREGREIGPTYDRCVCPAFRRRGRSRTSCAAGIQPGVRRGRGRPGMPRRTGRGWRRRAASRSAHSRGSAIRRQFRPAEREDAVRTDHVARARVGGGRSVAGRDRHDQHPPGVAAGDAPGGHVARAAARSGAGRRVPHSRIC